jgi:hypothetical protein
MATACAGPDGRSGPPQPSGAWSSAVSFEGDAQVVSEDDSLSLALASDGSAGGLVWARPEVTLPALSVHWAGGRWAEPFPLGPSWYVPAVAAAPGGVFGVRLDWLPREGRGHYFVTDFASGLVEHAGTISDLDVWDGRLRALVLPGGMPAFVGSAQSDRIAYVHRTGSGWVSETVALPEVRTALFHPAAAVDPVGAVFVAWEKRIYPATGSLTAEIVVRRRDRSGAWDAGRTVGLSNEPSVAPQLGVDDAGRATVLWSVTDGVEVTVWVSHYDAAAGWSNAQKVATNPEPHNRRFPRLAVSPRGDAAAVWAQYTGDRHAIHAVRYRPGTGWLPPESIGTGTGDESLPVVAANRRGELRALWAQRSPTQYALWSARFDGDRWAPPQLVRPQAAGYHSPQIALDDSGDALAAWIEVVFGYGQVRSSRWEAP